jgi:hypothetical protein
MHRPNSFIRQIDSLVAAIAGFLLIYVWTRHSGIGVSPDSIVYMSTAANIRHHGAINDFTGMPMMDFPAGYPAFLSTVMLVTGMEPMQFAPVLNGLMFAGLIFLSGWIMDRFSYPSKWYKWAMLTIILLSPCLLEIYSMLWSETLFLLLILVFFLAARRYHLAHDWKGVLWMGAVAALAGVVRYAGVSLILLGGFLMITDLRTSWKKKLWHIPVFGLIGISLMVLNIYRNRLVTGTLTGYREKAVTGLGQNLQHFGNVFCDWLPFFDDPYKYPALVGIICLLVCVAAWLFRLVRQHDEYSYDQIATAHFIVYALFILMVASISRFQPLDSRLLSPLFLSWLWGSSSWILPQLRRAGKKGRAGLVVLGFAAAVCMLYGELDLYKFNWEGIKTAGIPGFSEDQWTKSQTMDFIRHDPELHKPGVSIYSNAFEGIWFLTGVVSDLIPHKDLPWDIKDMMKENHFYVVWFDDATNADLLSVETIGQTKHKEKEYHFNDGAVYYFTTPEAN